jgi:hypothetical protein
MKRMPIFITIIIIGLLTITGITMAQESGESVGIAADDLVVYSQVNQIESINLFALVSVNELPATDATLSVTAPSAGTLTSPIAGEVTYTPLTDWVGIATFMYSACDLLGCDDGLVSIYVYPVNEPPVCDAAIASTEVIWPPNHKMNSVAVDGVTDPDSTIISITFDTVSSNEPDNGTGDGNTVNDTEVVTTDVSGDPEYSTDTGEVRAERSGQGDGRVYTISYTADDQDYVGDLGVFTQEDVIDGGNCIGEVTVTVPHDQRVNAQGNAYGHFKIKNEPKGNANGHNKDNANENAASNSNENSAHHRNNADDADTDDSESDDSSATNTEDNNDDAPGNSENAQNDGNNNGNGKDKDKDKSNNGKGKGKKK